MKSIIEVVHGISIIAGYSISPLNFHNDWVLDDEGPRVFTNLPTFAKSGEIVRDKIVADIRALPFTRFVSIHSDAVYVELIRDANRAHLLNYVSMMLLAIAEIDLIIFEATK